MSELIIPGKTQDEVAKKELIVPKQYRRTDEGAYEKDLVVPGDVAKQIQAFDEEQAKRREQEEWEKALCVHYGVKDVRVARQKHADLIVSHVPWYPNRPERPKDAQRCPACSGWGRIPKLLALPDRARFRRFLWPLPCPCCMGARVL